MTTETDIWSAVFAGIAALAAIITAVLAAYALLGSRSDSRARSRPVIIAELRRATLTRGAQLLVIKNFGQSVARKVAVTFDPEMPVEGDDRGESQLPFIRQRYASPIAAIAPSQALSNVYVGGPGEHQVPEKLRVTISYVGDDDYKYGDTFELNTKTLGLETDSTPSDTNNRELRQIKAIEAVARSIDRA